MEKTDYCAHHIEGKTERIFFRGSELLFCEYAKKKGCPYGNSKNVSYEGDSAGIVCLTEGLIKKINQTEKISK